MMATHTQHTNRKEKPLRGGLTFALIHAFEIFPHVKTQNNTRQFSTYPTENRSNDLELI